MLCHTCLRPCFEVTLRYATRLSVCLHRSSTSHRTILRCVRRPSSDQLIRPSEHVGWWHEMRWAEISWVGCMANSNTYSNHNNYWELIDTTDHITTDQISWDHLSRAGLGWAERTQHPTVCLSVYLSVYRLVSLSIGQCNGVSVYVGRWLEHQWYIFVCFVDMELKTHNLRKHHLYPPTHWPTHQDTDRPTDRLTGDILHTVSARAVISYNILN